MTGMEHKEMLNVAKRAISDLDVQIERLQGLRCMWIKTKEWNEQKIKEGNP
jgi:hypothetical protein